MSADAVFVTGATGFIGRHMVEALLAAGKNVLASYRLTKVSNLPSHPNLTWMQAGDEAILRRHAPNAVIHLATCYGTESTLSEVLASNVAMPLRLLELASTFGCSVFISTDSFFSKPEFSYSHMRPYVQSKSEFIRWASLAVTSPGCPKVLNCRLEHVYGVGDNSDKFIPSVLEKLATGQPIKLTPGDQLRDFIHVSDVVSAYIELINNSHNFSSGINQIGIGTGQCHSIRSFVETAKRLSHSNSELMFGSLPYRTGEIMQSVAAASQLHELGWRPRHDLESGLQATLNSMKARVTGLAVS